MMFLKYFAKRLNQNNSSLKNLLSSHSIGILDFEGIFEGIFEDSGGAGGMTESIRPWPSAWDFNISQISLETYCWSTHLPSLVDC